MVVVVEVVVVDVVVLEVVVCGGLVVDGGGWVAGVLTAATAEGSSSLGAVGAPGHRNRVRM